MSRLSSTPRLVAFFFLAGLAGAGLYASGAGALFSPAPAVPAVPTLGLSETRLDLGEREEGEEVETTLEISNTGGGFLRVYDFRTSCSCSEVMHDTGTGLTGVESIRLGPGDRHELVVHMTVKGIIGEISLERIAFRTNDPDRPLVTVDLVVRKVVQDIVASPQELALGTFTVGSTVEAEFDVLDRLPEPRTIRSVTSSSPALAVEWHPSSEIDTVSTPDGPASLLGNIQIAFTPTAPGPFSGTVELYTDDDFRPSLVVSVSAYAQDHVEAHPRELIMSLRGEEPTGLPNARCLISCRDQGKSPDVTVLVVPDGFSVEVIPTEPGEFLTPLIVSMLKPVPPGVYTLILGAESGGRQSRLSVKLRVPSRESPRRSE